MVAIREVVFIHYVSKSSPVTRILLIMNRFVLLSWQQDRNNLSFVIIISQPKGHTGPTLLSQGQVDVVACCNSCVDHK